jgi:hypothetical protein
MFYFEVEEGKEARVTFSHHRKTEAFVNKYGHNATQTIPFKSVCNVIVNDKVIGTGVAECSPQDRFEYRLGRKISFERALNDAGLPSNVRKLAWSKYFVVSKRS